ncbi:2TM domain-containing protein [Abyssalbus ytuae]|uniref:2TM domain-containing protein n=1 Tax=Abyssalbus ytuae TaxID=2926907 RepID=A0A9E6ZMX3_9FLAO|nr:2TM domain-containing protein [Abyssalbus ytuae]UOB17220.1 2TM domain-containing protein [Abyssalbus ytuae]
MNEFEKEDRYLRAQKRIKELKGFYIHLFWYVIVNIFVFIIIYVNVENNSDFWNYGTFSTSFFWGIGLFFHGLMVFGKNLVFSKNWEERKIKEFMDKDKF